MESKDVRYGQHKNPQIQQKVGYDKPKKERKLDRAVLDTSTIPLSSKMRPALEECQKLEDDPPEGHDDDGSHGHSVERLDHAFDAEKSSIEIQGADFDSRYCRVRKHIPG